MVADHMALWLCRQHARLDRPSRRLPMQPEMPPQPEPADPWERAIAQARREIRDLIETGDLDHDEMTARWVEQWAAAISIGRASGRERVCQDGEDSGVAGVIKK